MTRRQPTRDDHRRFCAVEGWTEVGNARGKAARQHETYELSLPDGAVLRTRTTRPPDRTTYGPAIWRHILGEQLKVTHEDFRACVLKGERPDRGIRKVPNSQESIPASLVHQLLHEVRLSEEEGSPDEPGAGSRQDAAALAPAAMIVGRVQGSSR